MYNDICKLHGFIPNAIYTFRVYTNVTRMDVNVFELDAR